MSERVLIYTAIAVGFGIGGIFLGRGIRRFTGGARGPALVTLFVGIVLFFGGLGATQYAQPYFLLAAFGTCLQIAAVVCGQRRRVPLRSSRDLWSDTRRPWQ